LTTYGQPTLSNLRAEKDYYTPKQIAEIYHVSAQTVCLWCRTGILKADKRESVSEKAKGNGHRWRIYPSAIEDIEAHKDDLIEASKRYWVRLLVKMRK
jgi:hypothetical protein